ncbi:Uncharacterized membrane protein YcaP, DUF421 family [Virgibacillus subterraneus]|uniref:Uncharacterized membrane protein YcaP, DUF421 family n=3 Tax=Bacillaceae TaxID=186817 RepID=A0A1H0Y5N6_9BACI|nr:Uncharacterized membrane protein YcaP, DUF421 family [Virgibacillus salinus]SEP68351.1 Uncharacterized membrane protein YcaP, DUF421 family [Virgibacillus subterraneus]
MMELDWIWKAVLIVLGGTFLLRFAGRKSISQMTLPQTVIMIGIGSLLIQPVSGNSIWQTLAVGAVLVFTLFLMEYAQVKGNIFERIITGKSKVLIKNGQLQEQNLKKLRLTVDQLEMNLRLKNVLNLSDIEWATLEPNGQVGFILKKEAQPVTKKEFQQLATDMQGTLNQLAPNKEIQQLNKQLTQLNNQLTQVTNQKDIFNELDEDNPKTPSPKHLQ